MAARNMRPMSYQFGTEAPKYPINEPYSVPRPDDKPLKRPVAKPKYNPDYLYIIKMSVCGFVIFASSWSFITRTSNLSEKQRTLKNITTRIRETQSEIYNVQAIISANLDLESIQNIAQTQLNMAEPLPHQVVYLELPQESYTVYND
ncbi:MAG: hypothetical protein ACRCSG_04365 [Cellulosilyticaceae bacterium]